MTLQPSHTDQTAAALALACAPIHKRALGLAVGFTSGCLMFGVTVFHLLVEPADAPPLGLLAQYFPGYDVSWMGALAGAAWGCAAGFVAGWLLAFLRNLGVFVWRITLGARVELRQTTDFLDHF